MPLQSSRLGRGGQAVSRSLGGRQSLGRRQLSLGAGPVPQRCPRLWGLCPQDAPSARGQEAGRLQGVTQASVQGSKGQRGKGGETRSRKARGRPLPSQEGEARTALALTAGARLSLPRPARPPEGRTAASGERRRHRPRKPDSKGSTLLVPVFFQCRMFSMRENTHRTRTPKAQQRHKHLTDAAACPRVPARPCFQALRGQRPERNPCSVTPSSKKVLRRGVLHTP